MSMRKIPKISFLILRTPSFEVFLSQYHHLYHSGEHLSEKLHNVILDNFANSYERNMTVKWRPMIAQTTHGEKGDPQLSFGTESIRNE